MLSFHRDDNFTDHLQDMIVRKTLDRRQDLENCSRKTEQQVLDCEQVSQNKITDATFVM